MAPHALVLSGSGRYADPWHPFAETSAAVAELLSAAGLDVIVSEDVDGSLGRLDGVDLLAVNTGDPWRNGETGRGAPDESIAGLSAAIDRGISVLALHSSVTSLRDYPAWPAAVGAVWLPDISRHPPLADFEVRLLHHPVTAGQQDFTLADEQYSFLQRVGPATVLAEHSYADEHHPVAWIREHGSARIAVDLLGHDRRSYASPGHRDLLLSLVDWLS